MNSKGVNVEYSWDFGDGSTSKDKITAKHSYDTSGEYTVRLSIQEYDIALDEGIANVVVVDGETNLVNDDETSDAEGTDDDAIDQPDESDHEKDDFSNLLDIIIQILKDLFPRLLG